MGDGGCHVIYWGFFGYSLQAGFYDAAYEKYLEVFIFLLLTNMCYKIIA